jgi:hypothetical protein
MSFRIASYIKEAIAAEEHRVATQQPSSSKVHGCSPSQANGVARERSVPHSRRPHQAAA